MHYEFFQAFLAQLFADAISFVKIKLNDLITTERVLILVLHLEKLAVGKVI